jgi:hypothetical protein
MKTASTEQTTLFGPPPVQCEYYPVLVPNLDGLQQIKELNDYLVNNIGLIASRLTKQPHISIDGIVCQENDQKVLADCTNFLAGQSPLFVEFTEVGYFTGRGGLILKLGIANPDLILDFNRSIMTTLGGKVSKLNLHLTLARYVDPGLMTRLKDSDIPYPKSTFCDGVALMKKEVKTKGAFSTIRTIPFGKDDA